MNDRFRVILHPRPEPGRVDTGLRFTDILFGFVIRELFLRLQNWSLLEEYVGWHLVVASVLVLGSWIGFRRSVNRTNYEVKFFNLPLFRFVTDQLMLILYFRIAVLTAVDGKNPPTAEWLATTTVWLLVLVFVLYAVWDLFGIWMDTTKASTGKPRYPLLKDGQMTDEQKAADWPGFAITLVALVSLGIVCHCVVNPSPQYLAAGLILLAYRTAKEVRTSWRAL